MTFHLMPNRKEGRKLQNQTLGDVRIVSKLMWEFKELNTK